MNEISKTLVKTRVFNGIVIRAYRERIYIGKQNGMNAYENLNNGHLEIYPEIRDKNGHLQYDPEQEIVVSSSDLNMLNKIWYLISKGKYKFSELKTILGTEVR